MRIAVITDVHANLPALEAALADIRRFGVDAIYHTGDAVGYGPFPGETLDRMLNTPEMRLVIGNHDRWFAESDSTESTDNEAAAFDWFYSRVDPALKAAVAAWPMLLRETFGATRAAFVHYGFEPSGRDWVSGGHPGSDEVERVFRPLGADLIFFGHTHFSMDVKRKRRYVNPGALGVAQQAMARYALVEFDRRGYRLEHRAVLYDDTELFAGFEKNRVPNWRLFALVVYGRE